jgi:hypothetical protein
MALKRLTSVAETAAPSKSKDETPLAKIAGRSVSRFIKATAEYKAAEATQKEERAKLLKLGLAALFEFNVTNPTNPATSIQLMQENEKIGEGEPVAGDGEVVRLTFQNRYSAADADTADNLFADLLEGYNKENPKGKKSINDFMQETVTAGFDSSVFMTGEKKEFNQKIFDAYLAGITKVTEDLVKRGLLPAGTKVPLATTKKVLPLANFHADRWTVFPAAELQEQLHDVVSTTVTLTPVAAK